MSLRAERSGKKGDQLYTVTITSSDESNRAEATLEVSVAHDQAKGKASPAPSWW